MRITIAAIGREKKSSPTSDIFNSYLKRIPWNVELKELEEKKNLPPEILMEKEAQMLLASIPSSAKIIAMDENGKNISSEELAAQLARWQEQGSSHFAFLIGGAAGHGKAVKERADMLLSFGKLTWPHMLVRPMLSEQIYRAYTIISGHPYHRS